MSNNLRQNLIDATVAIVRESMLMGKTFADLENKVPGVAKHWPESYVKALLGGDTGLTKIADALVLHGQNLKLQDLGFALVEFTTTCGESGSRTIVCEEYRTWTEIENAFREVGLLWLLGPEEGDGCCGHEHDCCGCVKTGAWRMAIPENTCASKIWHQSWSRNV